MSPVIEAIQTLATPTCLLLMAGGAILGIIFGAIPGLSGSTAIMILLPLTYGMDTILAMAFLVSIWIGGTSGSFIGSILLGIPGSVSSIATTYDGYAMTKNGETCRALSAGIVSNFMGTFPSIVVAMFASRFIADWAISFGPWEIFALIFCALTMVVSLSSGNFFKGMLSVGLGLLLTNVGIAPVCGTKRFTFGVSYLFGGFDTTCVMMGLFAGTLILTEFARGGKAEMASAVKVTPFRWPGRDILNNGWNIIRSFLIGLWIGFLPGMGPGLSNMVAYAQAKSASKHPEKFGQGIVDGVFAPEVANNASIGGAIIPMISLGIPGDTASTLLIAALMMQGIEAGPLLFTNHPAVVYMIFITGLLAALFVLLTEMIGMPAFPAVLKIPYRYLYPAILALCFLGAYLAVGNYFAIAVMIGFSLLGVLMEYCGMPTGPFMLAFVLGKMFEKNLRRALSYADNDFLSFFTRPISCVLLIIGLLSLFYPLIKRKIAGKKKHA